MSGVVGLGRVWRAVIRRGKIESGVLPHRNHAQMPSVGMRRTTRVFGARVLRSGRRLWTGPGEGKHTRVAAATAAAASNGEEWIELLDNSQDGGGGGGSHCKENGWRLDDDVGLKQQEFAVMDIDEKISEPESVGNRNRSLVNQNSSVDRIWGFVYQRKRKRIDSKSSDFEGSSENKIALEDRKYGKQFVRKQWSRKRIGERQGFARSRVLIAVVEPSSCGIDGFACLLSLILRYMKRAKLKLLQLSAFVRSEPVAHVFSSQGIHFLPDSLSTNLSTKSSGNCKFFGARCFIPLFTVEFSAVPFCFMYLHSSLLLRSAFLSNVIVTYSNVMDDRMTEVVEHLPCISSEKDSPGFGTLISGNNNYGMGDIFNSAVEAPKLTGRAVQFRNGVNAHNIRKRRSSLRSKRMTNPSIFRRRKINGPLGSNLVSSRKNGHLLAPAPSDRQLRSSVRKCSTPNIKELKSSLVALTQDIDSTCCSANILVVESHKCYRIQGATVKLEISASKQWSLAVKKDGITRHSLTALKLMRPCSCNRVTNDIIWTEDNNNWKLEFPDRRDWLIFKELYKECSNRNVQVPSGNIIPVPGVYEVSGYADSNNVDFRRPISYISVKDDELSRALAKRTANYDMDSDDEEWLRTLNNESFAAGNEQWEHVSEEIFELIIDAFEKAVYCSPDDYSDEKAAVNLCLDLERKEVVEAVYNYWLKKRKQKRSALIRVFQCFQPRKAELLPKPIFRKKRSFKRQASNSGRGKQRTFLQAMATEQDVLEEQNALLRVQEAKAAASRSGSSAAVKRQRAQLLMGNADLATYKAAMALRIAEAARIAESADAAASLFLE